MTQLSARRSATRERLLQAAAEAFAESGVLGATVEQICDKAGFTRGAFYSNFESKTDLCLALMAAQSKRSYEALAKAADHLDEDPGPLTTEKFQANIRTILAVVLDQMDSDESVLFSMEMRAYVVRNPEVLPVYREFDRKLSASFTDLVERLLKSHGMKMRLPASEAFPLLAGVSEHALLNARIRGQSREDAIVELARTVEVLIAPRDD